jgi:hypothetical protein
MAAFPFQPGANVPVQNSVTMRDAKGNTSVFRYFLDINAGTLPAAQTQAAAINAGFAALSNAALQNTKGLSSEYGVAQYGAHVANGAYESVIEKAVLVFQDASGQLHRFEIPAPKIAIFKTDKVTVDPANGLVVTFIALVTTPAAGPGSFMCTRQDIAFSNYMGGVFKARKIRRKLNILVLEPDLTASLPAE